MCLRNQQAPCRPLSEAADQRPVERHRLGTVSPQSTPMGAKVVDFVVETAVVVGGLFDAIITLITGVVFFVIAPAIAGVTLWFSWLLLFGG